MQRTISFTLNGKPARVTVDDTRMLLWVLRYDLGLTGTKFGCGEAQCGACTVIVDREAVRSCVTPVGDVAGKQVLTIEGLSDGGRLNPVQTAFLEHQAFQCGYCTPGMIMNAYGLLLADPHPSREKVLEAMEGNLCRCSAYKRILEAIESVSSAAGGRP